jgi:hypothetical protein
VPLVVEAELEAIATQLPSMQGAELRRRISDHMAQRPGCLFCDCESTTGEKGDRATCCPKCGHVLFVEKIVPRVRR